MEKTVGVVGLGIMGGSMARNLVKDGWRVIGHDIVTARADGLVEAGGESAPSARAVAERAPIVITSLPSVAGFHDVVSGAGGLCAADAPGLIVIETSTLPIGEKERGLADLEATGKILLDCPLSGTGTQAVTKDLQVLGSGDRAAFERCGPVFDGFSRARRYVGRFGDGSKMKFIANHLVNIHNVAAAEAMVLGMKAGLEPGLIYDVICESAATSRIFEIRGPMMVNDRYEPPGMKIGVWQKDLEVIGRFAAEMHCPTPLFAVAAQPYRAAMEQGRAEQDTAAVCAVLEEAARVERKR